MFDWAQSAEEINARNRLREESGLPPLRLIEELERLKAAYDRSQFNDCMQGPLREIVETRLLAKIRRKSGNPYWRPTGVLSGGGLSFHVRVRKVMRRLYWQRKG
jgi:hypothetical protein